MSIRNLFARLCLAVVVLSSSPNRGWAADGHELTIAPAEHGTLTATAVATGQPVVTGSTVEPGTQVVFTAIPDDGYRLARMVLTCYTDDAGQANARRRVSGISILGEQEVEAVYDSTANAYCYLFTMTATQVRVNADFARSAIIDAQLGIQGTSSDGLTVTVTQIPVIQADTVIVPAQLTDADGNTYTVTDIAAGSFCDMESVTDIYIESHHCLNIEDPTFDGLATANHRTRIHVYQTLLAGYATGLLSDLVGLGLLMTDITVRNRLFTFSNAYSVELPSQTSLYVCQASEGEVSFFQVPSRIIPANTGVMLKGDRETYTMVATHEEAEQGLFDGNDLVAVTSSQRISDTAQAYLLKNNEFWKMGSTGNIPDGKAYLHINK